MKFLPVLKKGSHDVCSWIFGNEVVEFAIEDDNYINVCSAHQVHFRTTLKGSLQVKIKILVSAFLWLHCCMQWLAPVLTTVLPDVMRICLLSGHSVKLTLPEMNANTSCLLFGGVTQDIWPVHWDIITSNLPPDAFAIFLPF